MNYALILAGGSGTRFWPLSRANEPKQFLNIGSSRPMMEEMLARVSKLVPSDNIYIAASASHRNKILKACRSFGVPLANILLEPAGRNTMAPIAFLSKKIVRRDPGGIVAVLPCDHFVRSNSEFIKAIRTAMRLAKEGKIVIFGFPPRRPETGYGYIRTVKKASGDRRFLKISRYVEKPDITRAKRFIRDPRFFWNAGTFIFPAETMLTEVAKFQPRLLGLIEKMMEGGIAKHWAGLPNISIDYAVMERTDKAVLIPADYGWLDLGSWQAAIEIMKKDTHGNILRGKSVDIGSKNTLVWAGKRLVASIGLHKIIVVDTPDALLVCSMDKTEDVRRVVAELKKRGMGALA